MSVVRICTQEIINGGKNKNLKQTFLKIRHINSQQVYEKTFNNIIIPEGEIKTTV
jgi:hypothetical protein